VQALVVDLHEVGAAEVVNTNLLRLYQDHWSNFHAGCIVSPWHRFLLPPSALHHPSMPAPVPPPPPPPSLHIEAANGTFGSGKNAGGRRGRGVVEPTLLEMSPGLGARFFP
jgi:hypothetical protein